MSEQPIEPRSFRPIVRISEVRDENDVLTYKMCCLCFEFIAVKDLWSCAHGQVWDSCKACAPFLGPCHCETQPEEK